MSPGLFVTVKGVDFCIRWLKQAWNPWCVLLSYTTATDIRIGDGGRVAGCSVFRSRIDRHLTNYWRPRIAGSICSCKIQGEGFSSPARFELQPCSETFQSRCQQGTWIRRGVHTRSTRRAIALDNWTDVPILLAGSANKEKIYFGQITLRPFGEHTRRSEAEDGKIMHVGR